MSIKNKFPNIKPSLNLDFANTKQLDPRITFTRASTATYWDGVTQAKAEENLLKYSQEFNDVVWTKNGVGITTNGGVAPDGSNTAELLVESTSANDNHRVYQAFTAKANATSTFSIYVKVASGARYAGLRLAVSATNFAHCIFDLAAGTYSLGASATAASIVNVGGGWFRLSMTASHTSGGQDNALFYISNVATPPATDVTGALYTGDGASGFYIWGAQLEQRSQATAYTPTTDKPITKYQPVLQTAASGAARFDHNPVTGESLGLLIEEQRTNLLLRSQEFDNAAWVKRGTALITPNAAIAPDGSLTADMLSGLGLAGNDLYNANYTSTVIAASGAPYTPSVYIKRISTSGTIVIQNPHTSTLGSWNVDLSALPDGWVRITESTTGVTVVTPFATSESGAGGLQIRSSSASPTLSLFIWGAQLEAGAFPTSYIPTTSEQVTRAADAASMTGTNFSSWYRQGEGTLFGDAIDPVLPAVSRAIVEVNDGTDANKFNIQSRSQDVNMVGFAGISKSGIVINIQAAGLEDGRVKAAFALGPILSGGAIGCADGNLAPSVVDPIIPMPLSSLRIGATSIGAAVWNGTIKKIAYYPKRLTNAELQALTT